jgi:hypothetical protein
MNLDKSLEGIFPKSSIHWENLLKNYLLLSIVTIVTVIFTDPTNTIFTGLRSVFFDTLPYAFIAWVLLQKSKVNLYQRVLRILVLSGGATIIANVVKPNNNTGLNKIISVCQDVGIGIFQGSLLSMAFVL